MKNVLMILHYPIFGGPHSQVLRLAPILEQQGWHCVIVIPTEPGNALAILEERGLDVVPMRLHRVRDTLQPAQHVTSLVGFWPEVNGLRQIIRARGIDVVQISGLVNLQGAVAARQERAPIVWQLVDTRTPMALRRLVMPIVTRSADVIMTTGKAVARLHPGCERVHDRLSVFYMPVDADQFVPEAFDRVISRSLFGFDASDLVVGSIGNLNPQKGHEHLLRAIARARIEFGPIKGLIVGSRHDTHRIYEERLHRLAASLALDVGTDVVFTGGLVDVRPALAAMDLFVLASVPNSEGAPAAVEEAMMMSRPVIATNVGSVSELVRHGVDGLVVPPLAVDDMADAIVELLRSDVRRRLMGSSARKHALCSFTTDMCASIHAAAFERAYASRRSTKHA